MLKNIIQEFEQRMEYSCVEWIAEFTQHLDFARLEKEVKSESTRLCAEMLQTLLQDLLKEETFLAVLKTYAGKHGQRFKEYREISVGLSNGQWVKINSPYFCRVRKHHKRKKRGPNGSGAHHGLTVLGFVGHVSPGLLADALQTSLLCPSYEVARTKNGDASIFGVNYLNLYHENGSVPFIQKFSTKTGTLLLIIEPLPS
ncbi:hypothetical protein [Candidatus Venteria ishoeyi]|uniref:Uncharacterized protein n=1 Tax=Candidatus Venteria ishoeyi TaxID=1899563 RepID=A0A1H6F435_9GAMM|nr:hypothetical protein [Candidatus Venteria ishoeyi]SEH04907.1 Uncharacterised protein [Candidatus Venteria ishoeyi]